MNELIEHIKGLNGQTRAWLAEGPDRFAGFLVEDLEYWSGRGISTVEEFELDSARNTLWDLYKDVHGIRPRWMKVWEMDLDEVESRIGGLLAEWDETAEYREQEHAYFEEVEAEEAWNRAVILDDFSAFREDIGKNLTVSQGPIGSISLILEGV